MASNCYHSMAAMCSCAEHLGVGCFLALRGMDAPGVADYLLSLSGARSKHQRRSHVCSHVPYFIGFKVSTA